MKFLVIDKFATSKIIELPFRPMIGDSISWKYFPPPKVQGILLWPAQDMVNDLAETLGVVLPPATTIDAVVYLD